MTIREQLLANVETARRNLEVAQRLMDAADKALYQHDLAEFERVHEIAVGDTLLGTQDFVELLHTRRDSVDIRLYSGWEIGDEYTITRIDIPSFCEIARIPGSYICGNVPIDMVKRMRAAWVARHEAAISHE